jgi:hypothetical protein
MSGATKLVAVAIIVLAGIPLYFVMRNISTPTASVEKKSSAKNGGIIDSDKKQLSDGDYSSYMQYQYSTAESVLSKVRDNTSEESIRKLTTSFLGRRSSIKYHANKPPSYSEYQSLLRAHINTSDREHYAGQRDKFNVSTGVDLDKTFLELMKTRNLIDIQITYKYLQTSPDGRWADNANRMLDLLYEENTSILEVGTSLHYMQSH